MDKEAEVVTYDGAVWLIEPAGAGYLCERHGCQAPADWYLWAGEGQWYLCEGCVYPWNGAPNSTELAECQPLRYNRQLV